MKNTFYYIIGGVAVWYVLSKTMLAKKVNLVLKDVRPGGKLLSPTINIDIAVQNPSNQQAILKSVTGNLYVNDKFVANFTNFDSQSIYPRAESIITITAKPGILGVYNTIKTLLAQRTGGLSATFTGSANVDGILLPINETVNI